LGFSEGARPTETISPPQKQPLTPETVARLYAEHSRELLLFLTGVLRDAHLASDVLQITYSRLLEQGGVTAQETRKSWLFRVAFNEAIDWRRKQARRDRLLPVAANHRTYVAAEPIVQLLQGETVGEVREAIDQLPANQKEVLRRRIYDDQTFAEIAKELKIPLGTALGRMRQALEHLRKILRPKSDHS
jgi:RNA polymerase sigma factor (sigma-70 family)